MLARIRERAVFDRFRHEGRRVRHGCVWMSYLPDPGGPARVAFALGRSLGSAPVRNRARRRLRAVLAARQDRLVGGWYLVGATNAITGISFPDLETDVEGALARLARLAPHARQGAPERSS